LLIQMLEFGIFAAYMVDFARRRMEDGRTLQEAIRIELEG